MRNHEIIIRHKDMTREYHKRILDGLRWYKTYTPIGRSIYNKALRIVQRKEVTS